MAEEVDHIGIIVDNLEETIKIYRLIGLEVKEIESSVDLKSKLAFLPVGGTSIELIEFQDPVLAGSILSLDVSQKGMHHVALRVPDLGQALSRLRKHDLRLLSGPSKGSRGSKVAWLDPRDTGKVLIELVERSK